MLLLIVSPSILSLIYSILVHLFLTSFHERSLASFTHWTPIFIRLVHFTLVGLVACLFANDTVGSCSWNDVKSSSYFTSYNAVVPLAAFLLNVVVSTFLIMHTRRSEVDGPPPPFPIPSKADKSMESMENKRSSNKIARPIPSKADKSMESMENKRSSNQIARPMHGKVVLITGANAGIGLETARQLYNRGATVILACRSRERAFDAIQSVDPTFHAKEANNTRKSGTRRLHFLLLDLTSISSVRNAVELFDEMKLPLHVLINNAGVMRQKREETVDGLEMTMAANHLGHFLLTNLLLPKLRQTAFEEQYPSKVITLSSSLYSRASFRPTNKSKMEFGIDLDDLQCQKKQYTIFDQYSQSKLANILFAKELGRREMLRAKRMHQKQSSSDDDDVVNDHHAIFCPIQSYAVHPGLVRTNVVRDMPWYLYYPNILFAIFMAVLQKTPSSGAYTSVFCAVVDDFQTEKECMNDEVCYYVNSEVSKLSAVTRKLEDAEKLWKLSCQLVQSDEDASLQM